MKQGMHQSRYTLRSKKPDMVRQEFWGLLLAYYLIRIAMIEAAEEDDSLSPTRLSFTLCSMRHIIAYLMFTPAHSASKIPAKYLELLETLRLCKLPDKTPDRNYPRVIKRKSRKYPYKKKMPIGRLFLFVMIDVGKIRMNNESIVSLRCIHRLSHNRCQRPFLCRNNIAR